MLLHVTEQGEGAPVCLLHGLFGRSQNLAGVARRLAGRFRVLSMDLRNHGASPHAAGMTYPAMAADILDTLAAHDALPVRLLGHSMGGKVAMVAALTAPAEVTRLVVADIAPVAYHHHNAGVARAMLALPMVPGLDRRQADAALSAGVPDAAIRGFLLQNLAFGPVPAWRIGLAEIIAGMADIEGWPDLASDPCYTGPTMFIAGGRSDYVLADYRATITGVFAKASFVVLKDAGHWLHADQPQVFGDAVMDFFDAVK